MIKNYYQYGDGGGILAKDAKDIVDQMIARMHNPKPQNWPVKPVEQLNPEDIDFILIDLFCGAGGTTTGFDNAVINGKKCAIIAACVNHDAKAIKSHWLNHPDVEHFEEDITTMYGTVKTFKANSKKGYYNVFLKSDEMVRLERLIDIYRAFYPNAKIILWASLECTNFSKAKGGLPRDQDSRTLADHLDRYIFSLDPDYIQIENVVEFMSWGPLDQNGKPVSKKAGSDFMRWKNHINQFGYYNDWKELNSADYGAYTSRNRLFGCFARPDLPIVWPEATHNKVKAKTTFVPDLFGAAKLPWKPVKDVLDFDDEGNSIFNRKIPLSEKTLERIYAGLVKYVAGGKDKFMQQTYACDSKGTGNYPTDRPARTVTTRDSTGIVTAKPFISTYNSGQPDSRNFSVEQTCRAILTANTYSLVTPAFMVQRNGGTPEGRAFSVNSPARTLTGTAGNQHVVQYSFIAKYYSGKPEGKVIPVTGPMGTLRTKESEALVQCFLAKYYGAKDQVSSINEPAGTIRTRGCMAKVWLDKSYSGKNNHQSIEQPAGTLLQKDKFATIAAHWLDRNFSTGGQHSPISAPAGSILSVPKINLVKAEPFILTSNYSNEPKSVNQPAPTLLASRRHYNIVQNCFINQNTAYGGMIHSADNPCPTIVASQGKSPLYITSVISGILENDVSTFLSELDKRMFFETLDSVFIGPMPLKSIQYRIVEFMLIYRIRDIKMRMLKVPELLKIQGFPDDYQLYGNQSDQKKFIGNSVHPLVPKFWSETLARKLRQITSLN